MGPGAPWIALGGVLASFLLASLYMALNTIARAPVEDLASRSGRSRRAARVSRVLDDTRAHARSVGLLQLVANLVTAVATVDWFRQMRDGALVNWWDVALGVLSSALVLWVFSVVLPMSVANHAGARLIYSRSFMLRAVERLLSPLHSVAGFIDEVVRRLAGVEKRAAEDQLEQEILHVIEEGQATGAIDEQERAMIESVVGFRDRTVAQIMTPRTQVEAMEQTNDLGQVIKLVRRLGHSRIPVYEGTLDHIIGIFYLKDLMHWLAGDGVKGTGKAFDLRAILRPPTFVPETKTVNALLKELLQKKVHIAVVLDEYGGTAGLVTIEDIVEEVFGDIKDEYESPVAELPDAVVRLEEKTAELDAAARITDVNDVLERLGVQIPTSDEYDTVGGFITTTLGRIPGGGEQFRHDQMLFTIMEAKPTRVVKVSMRVIAPEADAGAGIEGDAHGGSNGHAAPSVHAPPVNSRPAGAGVEAGGAPKP